MAAPKIESWDLSSLKSKLRSDEALRHLRVVKRGLVCTLVSGPEDDPWKHVRLRRDTVHLWRLEMAVRGGRKWERTPFRDTLDELLLLLTTQFPWTIAPVMENQGTTSDLLN
jgi:hypothetical protein